VNEIAAVRTAIEGVETAAAALNGAASAHFARMQNILSPILSDLGSLIDETNHVHTNLLIGDVIRLRELKVHERWMPWPKRRQRWIRT
jgi:hypothetical protein